MAEADALTKSSLDPHNVSRPSGYQLGYPNVQDDTFSNTNTTKVDSDAGRSMAYATLNYVCNPKLSNDTDLRSSGKGMRCAKGWYIPP